MNKYVVKIINVFSSFIDIEAENEEDAKEKVKNLLSTTDISQDYKHYYEATIPVENWRVITKEEFDKLQAQAPEQTEQEKK
jgi:hypothetical protein